MLVETWQENISPRSFKWAVKNFNLLPLAERYFSISSLDDLVEAVNEHDETINILSFLLDKADGKYTLKVCYDRNDEDLFIVQTVRPDEYTTNIRSSFFREYLKED